MSSLSGSEPALSPNPSELRCARGPMSSRWVHHRGLDGLRGVAVALVLVFHLWPGLLVGAWLGVGLFLTLSGFLVVGMLDAELTQTGGLDLTRFFERRVRRLVPAAVLAVVAALALAAWVDDQPMRFVAFDALAAAGNVHNWTLAVVDSPPGRIDPLGHFWSLSVEAQIYLVVPTLLALSRRPVAAAAVMVAASAAGVMLWWGSVDAYVATPVRMAEFSTGALLAVVAARRPALAGFWAAQPTARMARLRLGPAELVAAAAVVAGLAVFELDQSDLLVSRGGSALVSCCWVALIAASLRGGVLEPVMAAAPLRWLGIRSYGVYLFHLPLVRFGGWGPWVTLAVTLAAAEASWRLIETPLRRRSGAAGVCTLIAAVAAVAAAAAVIWGNSA